MVIVASFQPLNYRVSKDNLEINKLVGVVRVPMNTITSIQAKKSSDFNGLVRLFASGGVHGYLGLFGGAEGRYLFYSTRRDTFVMIKRRSARPVILSPDDPTGFERSVAESLEHAQ